MSCGPHHIYVSMTCYCIILSLSLSLSNSAWRPLAQSQPWPSQRSRTDPLSSRRLLASLPLPPISGYVRMGVGLLHQHVQVPRPGYSSLTEVEVVVEEKEEVAVVLPYHTRPMVRFRRAKTLMRHLWVIYNIIAMHVWMHKYVVC